MSIKARVTTTAVRKSRTCLKCGKEFGSIGPGNRVCTRCSNVNSVLRVYGGEASSHRVVKKSVDQ